MSDKPWLAGVLRDAKHSANLHAALRPRTYRPCWDEAALVQAYAATIRSEDPIHQVGACALRHDNSVAGVGYNGALSGREINWENEEERLREVIHAEVNCLAYCRPGECRLHAAALQQLPEADRALWHQAGGLRGNVRARPVIALDSRTIRHRATTYLPQSRPASIARMRATESCRWASDRPMSSRSRAL